MITYIKTDYKFDGKPPLESSTLENVFISPKFITLIQKMCLTFIELVLDAQSLVTMHKIVT